MVRSGSNVMALLLAAASLPWSGGSAFAQALPSMGCGTVQTNAHIRCTAFGAGALTRDRRAYWSDVPSRETLSARYLEESECHADAEARCDPISTSPTSFSTRWTFDQLLGSRGCEAGATGNGWIDPYLAWRTTIVLPRLYGDRTWRLTIIANAITPATIRPYPSTAAEVGPCHLMIAGVGTSKDITIRRGNPVNEQREMLSSFSPGEYLAELQCPAIQGSECRLGRATVSLQITASPEER
jgi:hypothetical protein